MLTFLTQGARDMQAGSVTYRERSGSRVEPDRFHQGRLRPMPGLRWSTAGATFVVVDDVTVNHP